MHLLFSAVLILAACATVRAETTWVTSLGAGILVYTDGTSTFTKSF